MENKDSFKNTYLFSGYENVKTAFDREARKMVNGECPQCGSEDTHIVRRSNRQGYDTSVICHKCGFQKSLLNFEHYIKNEESLMKVRINGRPTRLIVDSFNIKEGLLELTAHSRPIEFQDLVQIIKYDQTPHHKRTCNQVRKILEKQLPPKNELIDVNYNAGYLSLIIDHTRLGENPNYKKILSKILRIPSYTILEMNFVKNPKNDIRHYGQYTIMIDVNKIDHQ